MKKPPWYEGTAGTRGLARRGTATGSKGSKFRVAAKELQVPADDGEGARLPAAAEKLSVLMREAMQSFAVEAGLMRAGQLLEEEVAELCGRRYEHRPKRETTR